MKKKYYVGFFAGMFLLAIILSVGYQLSYRHMINRQEAKSQPEKTTKSVTTKGGATKNEGYYICELHGYVVVYLYDKTTVYEVTNILFSDLPADIQKEVEQGKYVEKESELYGFLENYSS